jgi:hypothetical protein
VIAVSKAIRIEHEGKPVSAKNLRVDTAQTMADSAPEFEKLSDISAGGQNFVFNEPLMVALSRENGLWNCSAEKLSLFAFGNSREEAQRSFAQDFAMMWDLVAQSRDESLTSGAQRVKAELLKLVSSATRD